MGWDSAWHGEAPPAPKPIACAPPRPEPPRRALAAHPSAPTTAVQTDSKSRSSTAVETSPASSKEMATSPPKRLDDPESPHRPRLTAEQTALLEEYFAHTPRPTTMQKKKQAEELGLTQEKVNNWFQNRRAKSKQQNKTRRELSILTPDDPLVQHYLEQRNDYYAAKLPTSPLQFSELAEPSVALSHEAACAMPDDRTMSSWPLMDSMPYTTGNLIGHHDGSYGHIHAAFDACASSHPFQMNATLPDGDFSSASSTYQDSLPEYALAPSTSAQSLLDGGFVDRGSGMGMKNSSLGMSTAEVMPSQPLLQDPIVLPASGQLFGGMIVPEPELATGPAGNLSLRLQAATNSLSQAIPPRSPSPVSESRTFSIDSSRRGSNQSDMMSQNALPLQQASPHPGPDSDGFKTPDLPDTSLASRRKRQRPANLISMRAASASTAAEDSTRAKTATLPAAAVRRIKSTGHNLNMFPGRVQKSGSQTPVRSPLNVAFFENMTQEEGSSYPDSAATGDSSVTMQMASYPELHRYPSASWATSPSSLGAPPLSASYTQNSFEESMWMASPPITPFFHHPHADAQAAALHYLAQLDYPADVPQSAPAHITSFGFPNVSPPTSAHPQRAATGSYPAPNNMHMNERSQSTSHEMPFFQPRPLGPATQLPTQMETASIVRPLSVAGGDVDMASQQLGLGQFTFLATPQPPPHKELEVVMAQFPSPPTKPLVLPRGEFTFQNSGPQDFGDAGD